MKTRLHLVEIFIIHVVLKGVWTDTIHRHGVNGVIEYPEYPNKYPNNANLTWMTYAPIDAISLSVTIIRFDLFQNSPCQGSLQIKQVLNSSIIFHGCTNIFEKTFIVIGNKMEVALVTNGASTGGSLRISWKVRDNKKENTDPIVVIYSCPKDLPTSSSSRPVLSTVETSVDQTKCFESLTWLGTSEMSFVKDAIIGVLFLAVIGVTTLLCCQRKKRITRNKTEFDSRSSLLADNNFNSHLQEDTLRSTTSSGYAIPRANSSVTTKYDVVHQGQGECEYMNTESVMRPASYIDVNDLEQGPMKLNQAQNMTIGSFDCNKIMRGQTESKYKNLIASHHSYMEVIGEELVLSSGSMTSSVYAKPCQDVINQLSETLKRNLNLTTKNPTKR
ncbi:uncharacterized protein LOC111103114 [Crassostrea virginica]